MPTALNVTVSPATVKDNQNFTLKGRLTGSGKGVANQETDYYMAAF
jgi:hypothetical protein